VLNGTGSESSLIPDFVVTGAEPSGFALREFCLIYPFM
jgi:hypothetical protein